MTSSPVPTLPLLAAQSGVWFAQQLDPATPVFNTAEYVEIRGDLDVPLFQRSVRETLAEADALAVRFTREPAQAPGDPVALEPEFIDLSNDPEPENAALEMMRANIRIPLDPLRDQLIRQALFYCGQSKYLWFQRFHHLLLDGFGFTLITRRVAERYTAGRNDEVPADNPFGTLADAIAAEAEYRESEAYQRDREFWLDRMGDRPNIPSFADGEPRPAHGFLRRTATLDRDAFAELDRAAKATKSTWPELLIAAYACYLHRWSGAEDVVLGLPLMNRLGSAAVRVPCMTVNVLPVRIGIEPGGGFGSLVRSVIAELRAVRRHQRYRGETLRHDLRLGQARLTGPEVNIKPFREDVLFGETPGIVRYLNAGPVDDLTLTAYPSSDGDRLVVDLDANPDRYREHELGDHLRRLLALLTELVAAPDRPVREAVLLPPDEQTKVIEEFNDTTHPVPVTTLPDLVAEQVRRTPDAPALAVPEHGVRLSYREFDQRVGQLAGVLAAAGIGKGDIVAVCAPRSEHLVLALHGVVRAGAAYLPVDPDYPADRIGFMLADAAPPVLLTTRELAASMPSGPTIILLDDLELGAVQADPAPVDPDAPAYLIYTSGSTGRPKGVLVSHRAIVNRLLWMQDEYRLGTDDRVLQKTPASFDVSVWEFFWPLLAGAELVVAKPGGHGDPGYLAELIRTEKITTVHFVPSMLDAFLAEPTSAGCTGLRRVICSGEALPARLRDRFFGTLEGAGLHNLYGPTEAAVDVTYWACSRADTGAVPIGRPIWNTRLYVLDADLRPVPVGVAGELYLAGTGLAEGYLNRPELTAERFVPDPFQGERHRMYRTGDVVRWRPDGALDFLGRADHQVKLRGLRIELREIEAALLSHPAVANAVAMVRTDREGEQLLVGYYVAAGDSPDPERLKRHLGRLLPSGMVPSALVELPELPLSPNGKLDRKALPAPRFDATRTVPTDPREQLLCELFAEATGLDAFGVDDDFFALGGHSLAAARLAGRIRDALGVELTIADLFAAPSPARLRERLDGHGGDPFDVVLSLRPTGSKPALWCVHPAGGLGWSYAPLLRFIDPDRPVHALQSFGLADGDLTAPLPGSMREVAEDYVRRLLAVQPEGPYHLLGWSIGGMIAHEMAVVLTESGREVGTVALLDAYPSEAWRHLGPPTEADALAALVRITGHEDLPPAELTMPRVAELLRAEGSALASVSEQRLARIVEVVANNTRLVRGTIHRHYAGDVLFFTATAPRPETWLDRTAWRPYVGGEIENHDLPCTHPAMVRPGQLARIAEVLTKRSG